MGDIEKAFEMMARYTTNNRDLIVFGIIIGLLSIGYVSSSNSVTVIGVNQNNITNDVNITGNLTVLGNISVKRPYATFTDNTTQTIINTALAYPINFSTTEDSFGVQITNKTNISFDRSGDYLIEISVLVTTSVANKHIDVWFQKNGVNIPRSNTKVEVVSPGVESVIMVTFIMDMLPSDNFRVMWASDTTSAQLLYLPAQINPTRPETPSIIMTISKISEVTL